MAKQHFLMCGRYEGWQKKVKTWRQELDSCQSCISYRKSVTEGKPWRLKLFNPPSTAFLPPGTTFCCRAIIAETLFTHTGIALDARQLWFIGHWMKQHREITELHWVQHHSCVWTDGCRAESPHGYGVRYWHLVKQWQSHPNGYNH